MKAITLQPVTVNVGSDVRNPSGYEPLVIPAGECIRVEEPVSLTSNVWIRWKVFCGKIECGHASRLIDRGLIQAL